MPDKDFPKSEEEEADEIVRRLSTPPPDLDNFRKIMMPMIRRIIPTVIANDIIGVQPIAPISDLSKIFSVRHRTDKDVEADEIIDKLKGVQKSTFLRGDGAWATPDAEQNTDDQ